MATSTEINWNYLAANLRFEQVDTVDDVWAEQITEKQKEREERLNRREAARVARQNQRRDEEMYLRTSLQESRESLLNRGGKY